MFFLSNLHGDSNVVSRSAKPGGSPSSRCCFQLRSTGGETATEDQSNEYDRILQLISNEDWKAASDAAASYLAKAGISENLQSRLRYIIIYTTEGAVSTGAFEFDVLDQRLKSFIGKRVTPSGQTHHQW